MTSILVTSNLDSLLTSVRSGDAEARSALFERFYPRVRSIVHQELQQDFRRHHRWILPLFSTGDIVQEVFAGVVQHSLSEFNGVDETAFVQYLTAVVKHRLIDALRYHEASRRDARRRVEQGETAALGIDPVVADPTPSLAASFGEQLSAYREVLDGLPAKQRRLLELRLEGEEPFERIAEALNIASTDAARQAFRSAKARLLVRLRRRGVEPPGEPT